MLDYYTLDFFVLPKVDVSLFIILIAIIYFVFNSLLFQKNYFILLLPIE